MGWLLLGATAGAAVGTEGPFLINAQQRGYQNEPRFIRDRFEFIDSLPFDGMTISTDTGRDLMNGTARSYSRMALDFAPLARAPFKRMKHNFALVTVNRPADLFDDWSVTIENFKTLARVLRMRRIEGILLDNEEYDRGLFDYPKDCSYPTRSVQSYQDQAKLRGREIMEAMVKVYPQIVVMVLHGPYTTFTGTPGQVRGSQTTPTNEELRGPFSVGMIEGLGKLAKFVDGGEVYAYRTVDDFQVSYDFRKTGIASAQVNCPFIPTTLRTSWPEKVGVAFGVYNQAFNGVPMDAGILRTTLERALKRTDRYVWLYSEHLNWNAPGDAATEWIDAVTGARGAVHGPAEMTGPLISMTGPGNRGLYPKGMPIVLKTGISSPGRSVSKVEFFKGATKLGETLGLPFSFTWASPPGGTWRVIAKATDNAGATGASSQVMLTFNTKLATRINFQPAGITPAVGYVPDTGEVFGSRSNGLTYGWKTSHASNMRRRENSGFDLHQTTLCQMQAGAKWEIAVPNGSYLVTVGVGDSDFASEYTINVEGANLWAATPLKAGQFVKKTKIVAVADGKLTIDNGGSAFEATRIDYVTVTQR